VLMLQRLNDDGAGADWIGEFAGTSDEDSDEGGAGTGDGEGHETDESTRSSIDAESRPTSKLRVSTSARNVKGDAKRAATATISGRSSAAAQPVKQTRPAPSPAAAVSAVRSSALTAPRAVEAATAPSMRADALAGIPVFKKEPTVALKSRTSASLSALVPGGGSGNEADVTAGTQPAAAPARAPKPARSAVAAFVPSDPERCVYIGNLPHDAAACSKSALQDVLEKSFGKVRTVHIEVNNNGKPAGFGYVEFASVAVAAKAGSEAGVSTLPDGALSMAGRPLRLLAYTHDHNYRNPDGSRKREKVKFSSPGPQTTTATPVSTGAGKKAAAERPVPPAAAGKRKREVTKSG
jgi:hypothetical protein